MVDHQGQACPRGPLPDRGRIKRTTGSDRVLERNGWPDVVFALHDGEEIGPRMLARIGRQTGLTPDDL
jgi:hypothetical protein